MGTDSKTDQIIFLFRHGETEWSKSGQHTGNSDIPLTERGREQAKALKHLVSKLTFNLVLTSPRQRAQETAQLAGLSEHAQICDDLAEIDYGDYEGITTPIIRQKVPGWTVWTHPCPNGETLADAAIRARRVIDRAVSVSGHVALFSHGHMLRILTATYLGEPPENGRHFMLDTSTMSVLAHEHGTPAVRIWNAPAELASLML